ncbi:MAG TPA: GNAT family N-acetyltransferase, partial [Micromonosporaceae bacterium]
MDVREATEAEAADWSDGWTQRLGAWWSGCDGPAVWPDMQVKNARARFHDSSERSVMTLTSAGVSVGYLALALSGSMGIVVDVWIAPEQRRRGYGADALTWATAWGRERSSELWVFNDPADPVAVALCAGVPLRAQWMVKRLPSEFPLPEGVQGREMTDAEFAAYRDTMTSGYADQIAASGSLSPADAIREAAAQTAALLPEGQHTPGHTFWTILAGGAQVATNWLMHGRQPELSFVYAVDVTEEHRGKGYGRAAMVVGERASAAAGDTHLALNVFGL